MSDFAGMEDLLQDFLVEATDLLSGVDNKLVDLEKNPQCPATGGARGIPDMPLVSGRSCRQQSHHQPPLHARSRARLQRWWICRRPKVP